MPDDQDARKIHIDDDWKAEAQAEKDRLAQQEQASMSEASAGSEMGAGEIPKASVEILISSMATQALLAMGAIADPASGQRFLHLDLARHQIDLLGVLEEKTKGNLTEQENKLLASTLYELRQRYIQTVSAQREMGG